MIGLPDVTITLTNGTLGRLSQSADGICAMILTGSAIAGKLELNKVYVISSMRDSASLGITAENNPLAHKELTAFFTQTGDGAEFHLLLVSQATTLTQMCSIEAESPLRKLIDTGRGRIRTVGLNKLPTAEYTPNISEDGIDADVVAAMPLAQSLAESYAAQIKPFRLLLPALFWDGKTDTLLKPREASANRIALVLASDAKIGEVYSAAVGQVLGRVSKTAVHQSIARVKDGAISTKGTLTNGKTPEECASLLNALNDAGYIFYRTYSAKNGYYLSDDPTAAPLSDDYSSLSLGRIIDKAIVICYETYISEIMDSVEVDQNGNIPQSYCVYYEGLIDSAIALQMEGEISDFESYVDPQQNILSTSTMQIGCKITPKGVLRHIDISLGFTNPALNS